MVKASPVVTPGASFAEADAIWTRGDGKRLRHRRPPLVDANGVTTVLYVAEDVATIEVP